MYGDIKTPTAQKATKELDGELLKFDQTDFDSSDAKMLSYGHVYIPKACKAAGSNCRLHIALHGCQQAPNLVGEAFVDGANYNLWADQNRIVVLYPATTASLTNPQGCWDWMAYTNGDYAIRSAPQMATIMKMVEKLAAPVAAK
jgi:poly(3-hydroxybutyrate) depolymerase